MENSLLTYADTFIGMACNVIGVIGGLFGFYSWHQTRKDNRPVVSLDNHSFYHGVCILGFRIENPHRKPVRIDAVGLCDAQDPKSDRMVVTVSLGELVHNGTPVTVRTEPLALKEQLSSASELRPYCRTVKGKIILGDRIDLDELRAACKNSMNEKSARDRFIGFS